MVANVHDALIILVDFVLAGGDFNAFVRPQATVNLRAFGDDVGVIRLAVVQPVAANAKLAAFDFKAF